MGGHLGHVPCFCSNTRCFQGPFKIQQIQGVRKHHYRLGGRELTLLCGFNQYTLLQNRDNSGLLGTSEYCSLKLGGGGAGGAP